MWSKPEYNAVRDLLNLCLSSSMKDCDQVRQVRRLIVDYERAVIYRDEKKKRPRQWSWGWRKVEVPGVTHGEVYVKYRIPHPGRFGALPPGVKITAAAGAPPEMHEMWDHPTIRKRHDERKDIACPLCGAQANVSVRAVYCPDCSEVVKKSGIRKYLREHPEVPTPPHLLEKWKPKEPVTCTCGTPGLCVRHNLVT